ncbi:unnamed protein product [Cochlearia groenlandica]
MMIPTDVMMEIFSRVPARSIARFRCLSKSWDSLFSNPDFKKLFLTMSSSRPHILLFTFQSGDNIFFFSSPQPRNPDVENTLLVPTTCYPVINTVDYFYQLGSPLCGFFCRQERRRLVDKYVICNPVRGESFTLPILEPNNNDTELSRSYLGYDPIDNLFKVLCINCHEIPNGTEHHVLTLGEDHLVWRPIKSKVVPHYPKSNGICIDGVLYYTGGVDVMLRVTMIVCFDVRSEEFSFIGIDKRTLVTCSCTLIDYKGRLGALHFAFMPQRNLELWVLGEQGKWSKNIYALPPLFNNVVARTELVIVGMTCDSEVVLSPPCLSDPFYVYYYNLERKSLTRVQIQGLEKFKVRKVYTTLDYVENLRLMLYVLS